MFELGSPISCRQYVWPDIVQKNLCFDADKNMAEVLIDHSLNRLNDPNVHKDRHPFFENQIKEQQIRLKLLLGPFLWNSVDNRYRV